MAASPQSRVLTDALLTFPVAYFPCQGSEARADEIASRRLLRKGSRKNRIVDEAHVRYQKCSKQLGTRLARASRKLGPRAGAQCKKSVSQQEGFTPGDDFVVAGSKESLLELKKQLESVYPIKASIIGVGFSKEYRGVEPPEYAGTGILYQHDPRHVDFLFESLGFENRNTVQNRKVDDVNDENPAQLDPEHIGSHVARCLFLSQDMADMTLAVNRAVPENVRSHTTQLNSNRLIRYLKGERPWVQVFKFGDMSSEVIFLSDSDWAGDKETKKSSSAGVALVGRHFLKTYTRKTKYHRPPRQERGQSCGHWDEGDQQQNRQKACDIHGVC